MTCAFPVGFLLSFHTAQEGVFTIRSAKMEVRATFKDCVYVLKGTRDPLAQNLVSLWRVFIDASSSLIPKP